MELREGQDTNSGLPLAFQSCNGAFGTSNLFALLLNYLKKSLDLVIVVDDA